MAVTITDQRTIVTESDSATGWTGSVTVTPYTSAPAGIETTACLGMVVSNTTQNAYFTITSFNFTTNPSLIYLWVFHRAELDVVANGGVAIQIGDGTNRIGFHVGGSDKSGFRHDTGPVGWQCFVLDTANLPSTSTAYAGTLASLNWAAITQIGVGFKTLVKAVGGVDNCFWDIIRRGTVGQGIVVTGGTVGSPGLWSEIALADRGIGNQQAYGIVRELGAGVYGVQGPITFGSTTSGDTYFSDSNATVIFEERGVTDDKYVINVVGNATGTTYFNMTNCSISAPPAGSAKLDASNANLETFELVNTQVVGFKEGVVLSTDATNAPNHEVTGCAFRSCGVVNLGSVPTRTTTFSSFVAPTADDACVPWSTTIDMENCSFISGGTGHAIKHTATGSVDYVGLTFTGYGATGTNNAAVFNNSAGALAISVVGGGSTPTYRNGAGASTTVLNNVQITLTGLKTNTEVRAYLDVSGDNGTEIAGVENSTSSFAFSVSASTVINIMINHLNYLPADIWGLNSGTTDSTIPISQFTDRQYANPA